MASSSIGSAFGFLTTVVTRVNGYIKLRRMEESVLALPEDVKNQLSEEFAQKLIDAAQVLKNIFKIDVGDNRTTDQIVAAGHYFHADPWINSENFPWHSRQGNSTLELIDMTQHGFKSGYSLLDALAVLQKLSLDRPIYGDGLLFGVQYSQKQRECAILFPHKPVLNAEGNPSMICLWSDVGNRCLDLIRTVDTFHNAFVAGVRKS